MSDRGKRVRRFDGRVIPIDGAVRAMIELYVAQFRNYDEAAAAIGINRDTIVKYNTFSQSMALYIFERMVDHLEEVAPERLRGVLPLGERVKLVRGARRSDHAQKDHVMYLLRPEILGLLKLYSREFPNIGAAGSTLGINPRTFKAYLDGSIESFPKRYFWRLVEGLQEQGHEESELLARCGVASWEELLEERRRAPTLKAEREELLRLLMDEIRSGKRQRRDFPRDLVNACYREFGSFGEAVKESLKWYRGAVQQEIRRHLNNGDVPRAHAVIARVREDYEAFDEVQRLIFKALPRRKRARWAKGIPRFKDLRRELSRILENFELDESRQYRLDGSYQLHDIIHHPGFGLGRVVKVEGKKRVVVDFFKRGMGQRVLVMNS
jgi:hypothetical protein